MPVERTYDGVCPWKGLVFVFASPGGLVNAYRKDLWQCLPVEGTCVLQRYTDGLYLQVDS